MRLARAARKQLAELIAGATSLQDDFFRSVAFRYFHPDDVISGEGARLNGGRFVPAGVRAVYASLEEETAMREVTTRKNALSGRNQINVGEYPRMTYVLSVTTHRYLDLASTLPSELANIVGLCLGGRGHSASQELAEIWIARGVESVVFPSATGIGRNVVVYLANAGAGSVVVRNRNEVLSALRRPRTPDLGRHSAKLSWNYLRINGSLMVPSSSIRSARAPLISTAAIGPPRRCPFSSWTHFYSYPESLGRETGSVGGDPIDRREPTVAEAKADRDRRLSLNPSVALRLPLHIIQQHDVNLLPAFGRADSVPSEPMGA